MSKWLHAYLTDLFLNWDSQYLSWRISKNYTYNFSPELTKGLFFWCLLFINVPSTKSLLNNTVGKFSWKYNFWVSSTSFDWLDSTASNKKGTRYQLILDEPFSKKGPLLIICVPCMIQPSISVILLINWSCIGHWVCRESKVWKIITEDSRVIQVLEFSFILMFWKPFF